METYEKPPSRKPGRPRKERNILNTTLPVEEKSCLDAQLVSSGEFPQDNEALKSKYDEMHTKGRLSWFSDGAEERAGIIRVGEPWHDLGVLEIGCGEGLLASILKERINSITAIDYSEVAINKAKEKYPNIDFRCEKHQDHANRYSRIIMQGVIEHLDKPFEELEWMIDNLLRPNGDIITSSPGFLNPRGIVWMTLDMLGAVMSTTDLHYLNPFEFQKFCYENDYKLSMSSCDVSWAKGEDMVNDLKQRIPLAFKDGMIPHDDKKLNKFMEWLSYLSSEIPLGPLGGATVIYRIQTERSLNGYKVTK